MIESQSQNELDAVDWQLLDELQRDARLSYNELARRGHLSAPSVAARVRRLERGDVITGYRAQAGPAASAACNGRWVVGLRRSTTHRLRGQIIRVNGSGATESRSVT